ncbi:MAG: general secretion pathway protein D [Mariniblastus sp.]
MRVSVRLMQNFWASALVVSIIAVQAPSLAFSQNQYQGGDTTTGVATATPGLRTTDQAQLQEAKRALLQARKALAHSDVQTAKNMLDSAKKLAVDFKQIGDSPRTVQSMIDRQAQLEELRTSLQEPAAGATPSSDDLAAFNAGAASFLLTQSEALMFYQDFDTAEMLIKQARSFPVEFNSNIGNPDELQKMIEMARNSAAVTQTAQAVRPAVPSNKADTMKLLSQAQLSMDQKRWTEAKILVNQAKSLGVADTDFAANEARPWQLELKIDNALNRQSFDPAVVRTNFQAEAPSQIAQAGYNPADDSTANVLASAEMPATPPADETAADNSESGAFAPKFNPIPNNANDFYLKGLRALEGKSREEARAYFERAWENKDQLDAVTLQNLQDKLTRLTMSSPAPEASGVVSASQEIDLNDVSSQQSAMFKSLQNEIFRERADAERLLKTNPREALERVTMLRGRVAQSRLDQDSQRPLLTIIDRDLAVMQKYIDENVSQIMTDEANEARLEHVDMTRQRRVDTGTQIQQLVEDFNNLIDEQRYPEARVVARQAFDLDPNNPAVVLLTENAKFLEVIDRNQRLKAAKEESFLASTYDADYASRSWDQRNLMTIDDPEAFRSNSQIRLERQAASEYNSEADRRIQNLLRNQKVQGEYKGTLAEAIDQLSIQAGVNIVFDDMALAANSIQKDRMVDVPIREPISLRSAMQVILQTVGLVYVVENEVIKVTTKEHSQTKPTTKIYYIGDLVMPTRAPQNPMQMHWMGPNMAGSNNGMMNVSNSNSSISQMAMGQNFGGNGPLGGAGNGLAGYGGNNNGPQTGNPAYGVVGGQPLGGITEQDFQPLMELIQNTIQPDSWVDTGQGLGTVEAFVPNLSLIVSQTQAIQDEIQDLLKKLRELNDVQIVVEVRFVSLRDEFFERVGIDFDFSINDNSGITDPNADFQPNGSAVIGRDTTDSVNFTPTSDLDLRFVQNSFNAAEPIFGGFQAAQAANFGFAILSDIEVFFLIQAAKGDQRTNITQAPTVTMFNGQSASVTDGASRPFVTSVVPVVGDFAVAHQPIITLLPDGTNLNVTAVVSDDRRYVRLQLVPFFTQVTDVETFTFDGSTTTTTQSNSILDNLLDAVDGGTRTENQQNDSVTTQGITVQLPVLSQTSVNTVVSVPDGGTVLMGGIKRMNESRTERGVPFLSNVPYINRLFKNVGIGHETSNLMMMVTPRIIIQEEIEEEQVGSTTSN